MSNEDTYWQAVQKKDASFDGRFFYGVITTGVFCRPGCAARAPLRENVRFYIRAADAQADGLRACQRCKPLDAARATPERIAAYIRRMADNPAALKLAELGRQFQMSPFHLQRTFKAALGLTPRQYAEALRVDALKEDLRTAPTVTDAIYSAGFQSSSRVYSGADLSLGMTPRQYRSGAAAIEISYVATRTSLEMVMIGATDRGLCYLEFGASEAELLEALKREFPAAILMPMRKPYPAAFTEWMQGLEQFIAGQAGLVDTRVDLYGTAFQLKVWRYLQSIPAGATNSYQEVAEAIGHPKAVRAVASACAANRVALVVPCHRVIRGDGAPGEYRWGMELKRKLLDREIGRGSQPVRR
jgi:AraC family transcriptional regulator, regulatory protein of adaptative response / methylated-DNA-[protein]-cysteine methyltransferase